MLIMPGSYRGWPAFARSFWWFAPCSAPIIRAWGARDSEAGARKAGRCRHDPAQGSGRCRPGTTEPVPEKRPRPRQQRQPSRPKKSFYARSKYWPFRLCHTTLKWCLSVIQRTSGS